MVCSSTFRAANISPPTHTLAHPHTHTNGRPDNGTVYPSTSCMLSFTVFLHTITAMQKHKYHHCNSSVYLSSWWKNWPRPTSSVVFSSGCFPLMLSLVLHYLCWETDGKAKSYFIQRQAAL